MVDQLRDQQYYGKMPHGTREGTGKYRMATICSEACGMRSSPGKTYDRMALGTNFRSYATVAELADAQDLGSCG